MVCCARIIFASLAGRVAVIFPPKSRYVPSATLMACAVAGAALACGPYFPSSILSDRASSLKAAPSNSFAFEAMHLVAKGPGTAVEPNPYELADAIKRPDRVKSEYAGLNSAQVAEI